jgi:O-antigen/teichoic acid export membrane protein
MVTSERDLAVRNVGAVVLSQLVTWSLTLLLAVVMPRYLGPARYGEFSVASAVWAVAGVLMSFGTDTVVTKAAARRAGDYAILTGTAILWRIAQYPFAALLVTIYIWFAGFDRGTAAVVHMIGLGSLVWMLATLLSAVLQGHQQMHHVALATIAGKAANALLGIAVLVLGFGIHGIAGVSIVSGMLTAAIQWVLLRRIVEIPLRPDLTRVPLVLRMGAPYVFSQVVSTTYLQANTLILATLLSKTEVGWYGVAVQVFATLLFFPIAVADALFPVFSRLHGVDPDRLRRLVARGLGTVFMVAVPAGLGLSAVAPRLLSVVFGREFDGAGLVLRVLGLTLVFMSANILLARYYIAVDRPLVWSKLTVGALLLFLIPASLAAVPWAKDRFANGAVGGAIGLTLSEASMTVVGLFLLPRGTLTLALVWRVLRIVASGLVSAALAWRFEAYPAVVPVLAGVLAYATAILVSRVLPSEDVALAMDWLAKVRARLPRRRP